MKDGQQIQIQFIKSVMSGKKYMHNINSTIRARYPQTSGHHNIARSTNLRSISQYHVIDMIIRTADLWTATASTLPLSHCSRSSWLQFCAVFT